MRRRDVLAAVTCGAGALAGCSTDPGSRLDVTPTPESTVPPDTRTLTEEKPLPRPDDVPTEAAARSFVETYERRYVYNELVDGFGTSRPATDICLESTAVSVVYATADGYYLLSTCRGNAHYYDPDGSPSRARRNAASVAHFVGEGVHRRIPFNAYRCAAPVVTDPDDRGDDGAPARFQIYDFETPPNYERTDRGGHEVGIRITDADGEVVLERGYRTSLPLTVQPGVTRTAGEFSLSADVADGDRATHDWSPPGTADPAWWALGVLITHAGDVIVETLHPNDTVGLPDTSLCARMDRSG